MHMSSENLLINLLALNNQFCNSPVSMNRRCAGELLVDKNDLADEESSRVTSLLSQLKIWVVGSKFRKELNWNDGWVYMYYMIRLNVMYSPDQTTWIAYFVFFLLILCLYLCVWFLYGTKLMNWIVFRIDINPHFIKWTTEFPEVIYIITEDEAVPSHL